ncbi:GMC oxidoreductase family protein [Aspergillus niger]|uniref:GMC oxidoreductase family protein n=1 Tax=Aspergillus niger TaxID=5061 RepID=A0A505I5W3_ASPNG|nr:GMC oxidoreductase family protein [Aspergillus niger]
MAPSFVTIDTTPDFDMAPAPSFQPMSTGSPSKRTLLLAPPSIATQEEKLRDLFTAFDRSTTDLQMLDRISAGFVSLPANTYDHILVLTDTDGTRRSEALHLLTRDVYTALVPCMKAGAKLQTQDNFFGEAEEREANDDDLIDEDTLLSDEDLKRPIQPPECQPKPGRRRRACKDCTCGLAARLEAEEQAEREKADKALNVMKLETEDLNELDFTVQGKTGSCGNCALGDAFRCAGCPFIGLPAFKPGQEVQILENVAQL